MPGTTNNGFDARQFAALVARFDTCNASEAEAISAARALRRMASADGLRIVDLLGRADVIAALDAQLQPVREDSPELRDAFLKIATLAEMVKQKDETIDALQRQAVKATWRAPASAFADTGFVNGRLVAAVVVIGLVLMIASAFH